MTGRFTALVGALLSSLALVAAPAALAQDFPQRAVRIVHPYPGGPLDAAVRMLAERLTAAWGQPVIVDPKPGASEILAADSVAKAKPDGYTWFIGTESTFVNNAFLYAKLPFDAATDLTPVSELFAINFGLIVRGDLPVTNIAEFVALARQRGGELKYASTGVGTGPHLAMEDFRRTAGFDILHVPYKAAPQAVQDLLGGQVDALFGTVQIALPFQASGRLKMLAITGNTRLKVAPTVPTFTEAGFPTASYRSSIGLAVPKGTPPAVIEKIHTSLRAILLSQESSASLMTPNGYEPIGSDSAAFSATTQQRRRPAEKLIRNLQINLGQ